MNQFKRLTLNSEICIQKVNNTTINNTNTEIRTNKMNNKKQDRTRSNNCSCTEEKLLESSQRKRSWTVETICVST